MSDWLEQFEFSTPQIRLIETVALIVIVLIIRTVILSIVHRRIDDAAVWFKTRKYGTYTATGITFLILVNIWLGGIGGALTYIGIVSAGIAIALSDVLKNLAGWAYIVIRRPFKVGDRVEIGEQSGDVVDIRVFRFTVLEIGNWVDSDQSTGRLIHIPNGLLFTQPVANYTEGFPFIWDEIPVLITFESDWERCEEILRELLAKSAPDPHAKRFAEHMRRASQGYFIRYTHLDPTVYVSVRDSGVLLTCRYLVPVRERRGVQQTLWKGILRALATEPAIDLAYPTVRTYLPDTLHLEGPGRA